MSQMHSIICLMWLIFGFVFVSFLKQQRSKWTLYQNKSKQTKTFVCEHKFLIWWLNQNFEWRMSLETEFADSMLRGSASSHFTNFSTLLSREMCSQSNALSSQKDKQSSNDKSNVLQFLVSFRIVLVRVAHNKVEHTNEWNSNTFDLMLLFD